MHSCLSNIYILYMIEVENFYLFYIELQLMSIFIIDCFFVCIRHHILKVCLVCKVLICNCQINVVK